MTDDEPMGQRLPEGPPRDHNGLVGDAGTIVGDTRSVDEGRRGERAPEEEGLRFDDPYWDDAFCAWWDPALRTCCS